MPRAIQPKAGAKPRKASPDEWATGILLNAHAIAPCPEHGFMKLKFHHAAVDYAHALAETHPLPGAGKRKSIEVLDGFLDGLSDQCPGCD
jgi:hypothetical protein